VFYENYLSIKTKLNNNGVNMPKPIQFKKLLLLMLLFSSSTNVFSQTKKDYIDHQWENSRYTNHDDGTVTDKKTGLIWKQCHEGLSGSSCTIGTATTHTYKEAIELAENTTFAKHSDWRVPNIKELRSLVARDRYDPVINSTLFPNTPSAFFWSSSPYADDTSDAWTLNFYGGENGSYGRSNSYYVRLVRGGQ
jgi:hypothetical protein